MSPITTHVLDTARGRPAQGVPIALELYIEDDRWKRLGHGATDSDGRFKGLLPDDHALVVGTYRIVFDTGAYFRAQGVDGFYPEVTVVFELRQPGQHYHVPLLLSPFGYSTYRGS
jgi:5-hydroxyisourate hydrolase